MFNPRPNQARVLTYKGGWMGVSAVPGSGKTYTLSRLAANLIASDSLNDGQEILIVTLVNSAVDNFSSRVGGFIEESGFLRDLGYRVRTLHGLAHDIVRERPDLAGLSDRFTIVDERESDDILQVAVNGWLRAHPEFYEQYTSSDIDLRNNQRAYRDWESAVVSLAHSYIRLAKDLQVSPDDIRRQMDELNFSSPLLELGLEVYTAYQRGLSYRSAVDFDDLIRFALLAIHSDEDYLQRLRYRWPYILEDEAQDSSRLQEEILRLLSGSEGNWVRVGDPNQAIYETFTTASPEFLRRFLREPGVQARDLPDSGRSTASIISLANELVRWAGSEHPVEELRSSLAPPFIRPTPPGDPQPNPPDDPGGLFLYDKKMPPEEEVRALVTSIKRWLPEHPDQTVAVLVPRNERGGKVVEALKNAGLDAIELLQSSQSTRQTADILGKVLAMLSEPTSAAKLAAVYKDFRRKWIEANENVPLQKATQTAIARCAQVEQYLWPRTGQDWLSRLALDNPEPALLNELEIYRDLVRKWQESTLLPAGELLLTIAQDLFDQPAELALSHKLALVLERAERIHPEWSLPQFTEELRSVARNERRLVGYSEEDSGFDPDKHKGQVVVATVHKAKGLEWDRVYLVSNNNYDFPSLQPYDQYISEKYFVRGQLNLEAEALAQLKALVERDVTGLYLEEGIATRQARVDYCAERLRLLFVGITRARRSLVLTWNTGRSNSRENQPSLPFVHMHQYWEENFG